MSSTQLIEQCATRLRGIVEALDNIHDTSPHRWSTDLDDVHSSAESLLALINDQAPTLDSQGLAGTALAQPSLTLPPFAEKVLAKLRRFYDCASDFESGGVDIGRHWLDLLTQVGLLNRVQRSPALWEITQQGEDLLGTPQPSPAQPEGAPMIGCLCGMPMTEGHHSPEGCTSLEEFAPQAQAEQAEAERPEVVAWRYGSSGGIVSDKACLDEWKSGGEYQSLMTVAQHERIVGALRFERQQMDRAFTACINERDAANARLHEVATACATAEQERDAALANVDALAVQVLKLGGTISFAHHRTDQAGQVPQAWLDVQVERRRQVEAEGWTPEHDDEHSHGQMARAAACYALAGSSAPNDGTAALLVSLAWPWDEQWWKPTSTRRDLIKACALALAEIERLDRAGISQNPQPGATTASS